VDLGLNRPVVAAAAAPKHRLPAAPGSVPAATATLLAYIQVEVRRGSLHLLVTLVLPAAGLNQGALREKREKFLAFFLYR